MQVKKIRWFASAWDIKNLNFLDKFNLEFNKVASAMIVVKFLEECPRKKHTFISTGMSSEENISTAIEYLKKIIVVLN